MSRGQKALVFIVFVIGLVPILFGKVAAFVIGCIYALLAAFFIGAFWGINDAEGVTKNLWFFKMFGFGLLPGAGLLLVVVFIGNVSPVWDLSRTLQAGIVAAGVLVLVVLGLVKHTREDALRTTIAKDV